MAEACVIGVDPGAHSAAALLTVCADPAVIAVHVFNSAAKNPKFPHLTAVIRELLSVAAVTGHALIGAWIEGQFVGENAASALSLARSAGRWQEACAATGVTAYIVEPSTWQSKELQGWRRAGTTTKAAAIQRCAGIWRLNLVEHAADAALIGRWAAIEAWQENTMRRLV